MAISRRSACCRAPSFEPLPPPPPPPPPPPDINVPPDAINVTKSGNEDTQIAVALRGIDSDGVLSFVQLSSLPANGTLYTNPGMTIPVTVGTKYTASGGAHTFYFVPAGDFHGTVTFQYTVIDNSGVADATPATATIIVNSVNDAPGRGRRFLLGERGWRSHRRRDRRVGQRYRRRRRRYPARRRRQRQGGQRRSADHAGIRGPPDAPRRRQLRLRPERQIRLPGRRQDHDGQLHLHRFGRQRRDRQGDRDHHGHRRQRRAGRQQRCQRQRPRDRRQGRHGERQCPHQ